MKKIRKKTDNRTDPAKAKHASAGRKHKLGPKQYIRIAGVFLVLLLIIYGIASLCSYISWHSSEFISDEGYTHKAEFQDHLVLNGIDVSEHQGDSIKWKKVKSSGVDFAFIRAGYRGAKEGTLNVDSCFSRNATEANKVGLMVGAYYYSQATSTEEAVEEARALLDIVDGYDIDLPLIIDYEIYPGGRLDKVIQSGTMNTAAMYHDIVLAFCRTVEDAGYSSGIYANTDMLTHYMDANYIDNETNLWVAEFAGECSLESGYRFWQCSDQVNVGGIDKPVDHDFMYINKDGATRMWCVNPGKRISVEKCNVSLKKTSVKYKRKGAEVKATVTDAEGRRMREGKDYTLSYVKNSEKGNAYVLVHGINGYRDIKAASYEVR
ncbi:MAG: glycoside hydrolase family 25 protein [Clostridiales bacterium]|nr:glycoside hydrolase family 25 protein [Candidatus Crickella caballi]